jgi:hypothetical protein
MRSKARRREPVEGASSPWVGAAVYLAGRHQVSSCRPSSAAPRLERSAQINRSAQHSISSKAHRCGPADKEASIWDRLQQPTWAGRLQRPEPAPQRIPRDQGADQSAHVRSASAIAGSSTPCLRSAARRPGTAERLRNELPRSGIVPRDLCRQNPRQQRLQQQRQADALQHRQSAQVDHHASHQQQNPHTLLQTLPQRRHTLRNAIALESAGSMRPNPSSSQQMCEVCEENPVGRNHQIYRADGSRCGICTECATAEVSTASISTGVSGLLSQSRDWPKRDGEHHVPIRSLCRRAIASLDDASPGLPGGLHLELCNIIRDIYASA